MDFSTRTPRDLHELQGPHDQVVLVGHDLGRERIGGISRCPLVYVDEEDVVERNGRHLATQFVQAVVAHTSDL